MWIAIGLAGTLAGRGRRREWLAGTRRVVAAYGVNQAIKLAVRRGRPEGARASTVGALSFPSAHATTSFCAALTFSRLGAPRGPLYALAGALAASRLALRVHHPSDVLAGAVLGTVLAR